MAEIRWVLGAALLLGGCASAPSPVPVPSAPVPPPVASAPQGQAQALPHYRCEGGLEFGVRFGDGSAELLFPSREPELLLRDAGGTTPQQTVYSNTRAKAQFDGREAKLNLVAPPVEARCTRD